MQKQKRCPRACRPSAARTQHFHLRSGLKKNALSRHGLVPSDESIMVFDRIASGLTWKRQNRKPEYLQADGRSIP